MFMDNLFQYINIWILLLLLMSQIQILKLGVIMLHWQTDIIGFPRKIYQNELGQMTTATQVHRSCFKSKMSQILLVYGLKWVKFTLALGERLPHNVIEALCQSVCKLCSWFCCSFQFCSRKRSCETLQMRRPMLSSRWICALQMLFLGFMKHSSAPNYRCFNSFSTKVTSDRSESYFQQCFLTKATSN